jgi:DNA-directed RNA polymerase specialized sigma24 family protein
VTGQHRIEDLLRECTPQVLAALVRRYGQFDACEDAVQEALLAATLQWPGEGIPERPRSWLLTVAGRALVDEWRTDSARRRRETAAALDPTDHAPGADLAADLTGAWLARRGARPVGLDNSAAQLATAFRARSGCGETVARRRASRTRMGCWYLRVAAALTTAAAIAPESAEWPAHRPVVAWLRTG